MIKDGDRIVQEWNLLQLEKLADKRNKAEDAVRVFTCIPYYLDWIAWEDYFKANKN